MRKLMSVIVVAMISFASTIAVTPRAQALPEFGYVVYYYNYGSPSPDGYEIDGCTVYSEGGDTTPTDFGELKEVITVDCSSSQQTVEWYRWSAVGCEPLHWIAIPAPFYNNYRPC